jgi:hypothetical protein
MLSHESQNFAHVPRNGRLRKIPKKVQEFCLHLSLTGSILGQRNDATSRFKRSKKWLALREPRFLSLYQLAIEPISLLRCAFVVIPPAPAI